MIEKILVYVVVAFVALTLIVWLYRFLSDKDMETGCGGCGSCTCGKSDKDQ